PAVDVLRRYSHAISTHDPRTRMISNRDGHVVHDGRELLTRLVEQVSNPVRWDLCQQTMADLGLPALLDVLPVGSLDDLANRALPGCEIFDLRPPDKLGAAQEFVERHGQPSPMADSPPWRLVVEPVKGTFVTSGVAVGDQQAAGA